MGVKTNTNKVALFLQLDPSLEAFTLSNKVRLKKNKLKRNYNHSSSPLSLPQLITFMSEISFPIKKDKKQKAKRGYSLKTASMPLLKYYIKIITL